MNYFNVNSVRDLSIVRVKFSKVIALSMFGIVFFYSITLQSFAADECTFSPTINCPLSVTLQNFTNPVTSGGNTNVTAVVDGIFQWNAVSVTYFSFNISHPATNVTLGGSVVGNTGPLASRQFVEATAENSETVFASDSMYIEVTAPSAAPQVNIQFSFLDKVRQFFGAKIGERTNIFALEK